MTKEEARTYVKSVKKMMTEEEVVGRSLGIIEKVMALPEFKEADNIYTYVSYNQEVDTKNLIRLSLDMGKNIFVPKVYDKIIKFHKIDRLELLNLGKYGILEPGNDFLEEWDNVDGVMIMPGLAFGRDFSRAGYGGGFYDRFLEAHKGLKTIGVCFDFQIVDSIEINNYDYRPDIIVSESNIFYRKKSEDILM